MIQSFTGTIIAYAKSFRDLKILHADAADKPVDLPPSYEHSRHTYATNDSPLGQDVEAQIERKSSPPSVLLVSMNITVFIMSLYAMAATARSYALYNGHKHDGRRTPGQRPWPDVVNFDDINCILPISIASLVQSAICFVTLLTTPRPGPIYFFVLSILVLAYSITIPYLWGTDVFKTGVHDSNPNLYSMLGDWACHLETEPIPFYREICDRMRAAVVLFTIAYVAYWVSWVATLCSLIFQRFGLRLVHIPNLRKRTFRRFLDRWVYLYPVGWTVLAG